MFSRDLCMKSGSIIHLIIWSWSWEESCMIRWRIHPSTRECKNTSEWWWHGMLLNQFDLMLNLKMVLTKNSEHRTVLYASTFPRLLHLGGDEGEARQNFPSRVCYTCYFYMCQQSIKKIDLLSSFPLLFSGFFRSTPFLLGRFVNTSNFFSSSSSGLSFLSLDDFIDFTVHE